MRPCVSIFTETICQAIKQYLKIAKRQYDPAVFSEKKERLALDQLDPNDSAGLYCAAKHIVFDIAKDSEESVKKTQYAYSGITQFSGYLEDFLSHYTIENNGVVHRAQKVSGFMISNVQILSLPPVKLTAERVRQVKHQQQFIIAHGAPEQIDLYKHQINGLPVEPGSEKSDLIDYLKSQLFPIDSAA
jgi:hypothetical protein